MPWRTTEIRVMAKYANCLLSPWHHCHSLVGCPLHCTESARIIPTIFFSKHLQVGFCQGGSMVQVVVNRSWKQVITTVKRYCNSWEICKSFWVHPTHPLLQCCRYVRRWATFSGLFTLGRADWANHFLELLKVTVAFRECSLQPAC